MHKAKHLNLTSLKTIHLLIIVGAFVIVGILFTHVSSAQTPNGQQVRRELQWEGITRSYYIYVPTSYDAQASYPLVLVLHGSGGNAVRQANTTQYAQKAEAENFIVVHANGHPANVSPAQQLPDGNHEWNARTLPPPDDTGFLNKVIDEVEATHNIDKNRVYMSGFSNGASMTNRMSCEFTSRFAAMAPVSGNWAFGANGSSGIADFACTPTRPIPTIYFRGTAEASIPTRDNEDVEFEQFWSNHNGCDASPVVDTMHVNGETITRERYMNCTGGNDVTIMNVEGNSHRWHASATDETWNFLKQFSLNTASPPTITPTPTPIPTPTSTPYPTPTPTACTYDFSSVTTMIEDRVRSQPLQGASLLIIKDGRVIYEQAFGGYTLDTRVPIASATKWVSASVIMSLIDDGTLHLDDKVSQFIPSFTGDKENITIRQLLSHTSGLPGGDLGCLGDANTSLAQCAEQIAQAPLIAAPGTAFAYGGNSFQVAGRIAEVATGKFWDDLFQGRLRNLLGMTSTDYGFTATATDYVRMTNPRIAGGIRSTLRDYGNFVLMHSNKGVFNNLQVLSEGVIREGQIDQTLGAPTINSPSPIAKSYGLGQFRDILDAQGEAIQLSSQGAFGFSPWIDTQRGLACVFLVQNQFRNVSSFVTQLQGEVRNTVDAATCAPAPTTNQIDDSSYFVRQHYLDFLNREPDAPGLAFWTSEIMVCGTDAVCIDRKRTNTSGAFFLSEEFQATGYYVYRIYMGSLGRVPHYAEFVPDASRVAAGIVVDNRLSPDVINRNKAEFAKEFVGRAEFLSIYNALTEEAFVDLLFQTTGVARTDAERQALVDELRSGAGTLTERRAAVLGKVVDGIRATPPANGGVDVDKVFETSYGRGFYDAHFNRAFVLMQYFGYLRHDPDQEGYNFWLSKLNRFGNFHDAEMVKAFVVSDEYRSRFGQP